MNTVIFLTTKDNHKILVNPSRITFMQHILGNTVIYFDNFTGNIEVLETLEEIQRIIKMANIVFSEG